MKYLIFVLFLAGCATQKVPSPFSANINGVDRGQSAGADKKTGQLAKTLSAELSVAHYMSLRKEGRLRAQNCPNSDTTWKKENREKIIDYANACVAAANWARLQALGDWLAQREPYAPWGAFYLSVAAQGTKEYPRALWMIDLALKKSPQMPLLHYQKGRIHWELQEYSASVNAFKESIKLNSSFADAQLFLAQLYFKEQNFKDSEIHFKQFIALEPDNGMAHAGLGEIHILRSRIDEAIASFTQAVNLSPRHVGYRVKLAGLLENNKKDYLAALNTYKKLQSLLTQERINLKELPFDLNEKIKKLEAQVSRDLAQETSKGSVKK